MKKILKLPLRRIPRRPPPAEPLRAKAAADAGTYENDDYEAEEEPNMKFSHALIVVLALHIIAVGGVFAFNSIKAGQSGSTKASAKDESAPATAQANSQPKATPAQQPLEARAGKTHTVQAGDTLSRIASLYKINVEAIEKENGITTYSMIRVGQVLKIPASDSAGKSEGARTAADPATASAKHAFLVSKTDAAKQPVATAKTDAAKPGAASKTDIPKTDTGKPSAIAASTPKPASAQPSPKKAETPAPVTDSDVYVVAKGDNPYNIAKKLHVSYNDLIALNEIKDPTRVQIGQKLKIPAKKN
jgi:LysM repeat protein